MNDQSYSTSFVVDQSPEAVFAAINRVPDWWSGEVVGGTGKMGDVFSYTVPGIHYSQQTITELVPGRRVVWHVSDAELTFVQDKKEWKGTDIVFEIAPKGGSTEVRFTHRGLVPDFQCHEACSNGWNLLVGGNLKKFIATGKPQPSPFS
jgi:uncharacterized protein YndB with AHSA1/START domain